MFGKILYPTDFSNASVKALEYVKQAKASDVGEEHQEKVKHYV